MEKHAGAVECTYQYKDSYDKQADEKTIQREPTC